MLATWLWKKILKSAGDQVDSKSPCGRWGLVVAWRGADFHRAGQAEVVPL